MIFSLVSFLSQLLISILRLKYEIFPYYSFDCLSQYAWAACEKRIQYDSWFKIITFFIISCRINYFIIRFYSFRGTVEHYMITYTDDGKFTVDDKSYHNTLTQLVEVGSVTICNGIPPCNHAIDISLSQSLFRPNRLVQSILHLKAPLNCLTTKANRNGMLIIIKRTVLSSKFFISCFSLLHAGV